MKKVGFIFLLVFIIFLALGSLLFYLSQPIKKDSSNIVLVEIKSGWGTYQIGKELKEKALIRSIPFFQFYVWLKGINNKLKAGKYELMPSQSLAEITQILVRGEKKPTLRIRIKEGATKEEIASYLASMNLFSEEDFLNKVNVTDSRKIIPEKEYDFLKDKPLDKGLEGFLFPDTYFIYNDASPEEVIEKMLDNFNRKLTSDLREAITRNKRSIYQVVILASILEKELKTYEEKRLAADIFYRRLEKGMPLQADATLNYITGKNNPQASPEDLNIDSPYNTYKYSGLPPTPIGNPSLESIKAAIYPKTNDFWYYLTKPSGEAVFAKTFEEHLRNKNLYLKK